MMFNIKKQYTLFIITAGLVMFGICISLWYMLFYANKDAGAIVDSFFGAGWEYKQAIAIQYPPEAVVVKVENLLDYQIPIQIPTGKLNIAGKLKDDCDDLRFVDSNNRDPLNYYYEGSCLTGEGDTTKIWVRTGKIPVGGKVIYLYYGNPNADPYYNNLDAAFSYNNPEQIAYVLNDIDALEIVSLEDNGAVRVNKDIIDVDKGGSVSISKPRVIVSKELVQPNDSNNGAVVPASWAGKEFEVPIFDESHAGDTVEFLLYTNWLRADVVIKDDSGQGDCDLGEFSVGGSISKQECKVAQAGSGRKMTINSSEPILVAYREKHPQGGLTPYRPLYPGQHDALESFPILTGVVQDEDKYVFAPAVPKEEAGILFGANIGTDFAAFKTFKSTECKIGGSTISVPASEIGFFVDNGYTVTASNVMEIDFDAESFWTMSCNEPVYAIYKPRFLHGTVLLYTQPMMRAFSYPSPYAIQKTEAVWDNDEIQYIPYAPTDVTPDDIVIECPRTYVPRDNNQYVNVNSRLGWWYIEQRDGDVENKIISQYIYDVYLVSESDLDSPSYGGNNNGDPLDDIDNFSGDPANDPLSLWADHHVCQGQTHELSEQNTGGGTTDFFTDLPQQCFPQDPSVPLDASPTVLQLRKINLTQAQAEFLMESLESAPAPPDRNLFGDILLKHIDEDPSYKLFLGTGLRVGSDFQFDSISVDPSGSLTIGFVDTAEEENYFINITKKAFSDKLRELIDDDVSAGNEAYWTDTLINKIDADIDIQLPNSYFYEFKTFILPITASQLMILEINYPTSPLLTLTPNEITALVIVESSRSTVDPSTGYFWRLLITVPGSSENWKLCPEAEIPELEKPLNFKSTSIEEVKHSASKSEPTEQFIYDARVIANPPPGFIDTLSDLPVFEQKSR